jgi:AcrR family transcriptional regulator
VVSTRATDVNARRARAERILDAAAELMQRWGYKRLTMDDVAEHAGIGKGTIYLHWKTREALFEAVLQREIAWVADALLDSVREDPSAVMPHRMAYNYYVAVTRRPLVRALFTANLDVLGKLATSDWTRETAIERLRVGYVQLLVEHGLVRQDVTPQELAYTFRAVLIGFLVAVPLGGHSALPPPERQAELVKNVIQRAFEIADSPPPAGLPAIAARAIEMFTEVGDAAREQLRHAYE